MSRIHEALKKAEQERATVRAASGGVLTAARRSDRCQLSPGRRAKDSIRFQPKN